MPHAIREVFSFNVDPPWGADQQGGISSSTGQVGTWQCNPACAEASQTLQMSTCTQIQIQKYAAKISGPLLDRIDLHSEVSAIKYKEMASKEAGECSTSIRQ